MALAFFPASGSSEFGDLCTAFLGEHRCACVAAFQSTKPAKLDSGGQFGFDALNTGINSLNFWGKTWNWLTNGQCHNLSGASVCVPWQLFRLLHGANMLDRSPFCEKNFKLSHYRRGSLLFLTTDFFLEPLNVAPAKRFDFATEFEIPANHIVAENAVAIHNGEFLAGPLHYIVGL